MPLFLTPPPYAAVLEEISPTVIAKVHFSAI